MVVVWGNLPKAQDDNETIEEAIARLIDEHNEDETSHLGSGQSLQSHKASEIIDHLADSVVEDKIINLGVTPQKLNINSLYSQVQLESLDAWTKIETGTDAAISLNGVGVVACRSGDEASSLAVLNTANPIVASHSEKDPFFQILVADGGDEVNDIGISFGLENPFDTDNGGFGIEYIVDDNKVYGFYNTYYESAWHRQTVELKTGVPYNEIWRAEFDHTNQEIRFYIDNTLVQTMDISGHYYEFDDDYYLAFGARKDSNYPDAAVWFMNPIFNQNI